MRYVIYVIRRLKVKLIFFWGGRGEKYRAGKTENVNENGMVIVATGVNCGSWMQQAQDRGFGISGFEFRVFATLMLVM